MQQQPVFVKLIAAKVVKLLVRVNSSVVVALVLLGHRCCHSMHWLSATLERDVAHVTPVL